MSDELPQVDLIREAFYYKSRFIGSVIVFKIDFPVTRSPGFPSLMKDLALLAQTGFKIIIVPGAKEFIDATLKQYEVDFSHKMNGDLPVRITTAKIIPFVEMAAFNVASQYMTYLSGSRVEALIGNFVRARGLGVQNGIDMEHTGTVDKIYADSISRVLNLGMVPILPCIGWSPSGKPYNVPSEEIALAVCDALGAAKLFIVSTHESLKACDLTFNEKPASSSGAPAGSGSPLETRADGSLIRLTPAQTEALIEANSGSLDINKQALRGFKLALQAARAGVDRVHIIDGRVEGTVLRELFSNLGAGTMIYNDEYESIRAFRSGDLTEILRLMEPLMEKGILVRRSAEQILEKKDDYAVFEIDGSIHACAALHDWGEAQGEIAAVATDPMSKDLGLGRRIVGYFIEKARKNSMKRVFALTTATQDWFEALGFKEVPVESLPQQKLKNYDQSRKSKVFALDLLPPVSRAL
jgi:amino-acid N-acetyltransferase